MKPSITTKLIEATGFRGWKTLIFCIFVFGLLPYVLLTFQLCSLRKNEISATPISIVFMYLMFSWSWIGPYSIWLYETKLRPNFWKEVCNLFLDEKQIHSLKIKFDENMLRRYWTTILLWQSFAIYAFFSISPFMTSFGLKGISDYVFWVWVLFIWHLGFLSGHGFAGIFDTIRIIRSISKMEIVIDQYHHDGHGGSLCIGNLTIWTFGLFSTGSVFLPILFSALNYQGLNSTFSVLFLIFLFCLATLSVFMYPLFHMHYRILEIKQKIHKKIKEYAEKLLVPECINGSCDISEQLKILNFRNYYIDLDRVATFPVNTRLLAEVIFFAFLPFIMVLIQKLLV